MHQLFLLHLGQLGVRDELSGEARYSQVPGYLIRTAGGRTILVDTGNPAALIGRETSQPWWPLLNHTRPEDDIVPRLAEMDLTPSDIDLLISTHFDFDHCGRHDAFAAVGITSCVQRAHLEAARDDPRFDNTLWDLPGIDYVAVDGEFALEPGLRLLPTSGHVIGHQSVFVETTDGPVVLAIDAIAMTSDLTATAFPPTTPDPDVALASRDRLLALAKGTGAYLIMGHNGGQWARLPKSPAPYRRPAV